MAGPRSFAELYNWLRSVLPLTWDATKKPSPLSIDVNNRLVLPVGLKFPSGSTQDDAATGGWSPIDKDVVGYWPLDEEVATGAWCSESKYGMAPASGYPGVDTSGPGGRRARTFDSSSNKHFEYNPNVQDYRLAAAGQGSWTIEGWAKLQSAPATAWPNCAFFLGDPLGGNIELARLVFGKWGGTNPGTLNVEWGNSGGYAEAHQTAGSVLPFDSWGHFAARKTRNQSTGLSTVDFFVNGAPQQSITGLADCPITTSAVAISIGWSIPDNGASVKFDGSLALLRFSRKARSDQEISDYYNNSPTLG